MSIKAQIPNVVTLFNLTCGFLAVVVCSFNMRWACYLILLAAVFDLLDGLVARALNVSSEMGKQLDSLADVVSFGVAPAVMLVVSVHLDPTGGNVLLVVFVLLPLAAAWRLARFNIDTSQTNHFRGLPVPANGMFWAGFLYYSSIFTLVDNYVLWISALTILFSAIMVSRVKLLNLKFNSTSWRGNEGRYGLLLICLPVFIYFASVNNVMLALPVAILLYLIFSIFHYYLLPARTDEKIQS